LSYLVHNLINKFN